MKFSIDYTGQCLKNSLYYNINEYSFDTNSDDNEIDFYLAINQLNLSVTNSNEITQVWGFCPYGTWVDITYQPPIHRPGRLIILDELEAGYSYKINKHDWPIFFNIHTNWICIGDPIGEGRAVEFMNGCVSVINNNSNIISLWLKPFNALVLPA